MLHSDPVLASQASLRHLNDHLTDILNLVQLLVMKLYIARVDFLM